MQDTPLDQPPVNEFAAAPLQTAPRRMRKPLVRGLLVGFIPLGLSVAWALIQIKTGGFLFPDYAWVYLLLGIYCSAWVGAVLFRIVSTNQSTHSLACGMMISLVASVVIALCVVVSLVLYLLS